MASIHEAIFDRLVGHGGVNALVAGRVYRNKMPQNEVMPCIVYQRISKVKYHAMGVEAGVATSRFQFTAWAVTHAEAEALEQQIRLAIARWSGTQSGVTIQDSLEESQQEDFEPDTQMEGVHQIPTDYMISYVEA